MSDIKRSIRSPRRNRPPEQVAVNKCGAVSLLSLLRHIGLPDRTIFDVSFDYAGRITLIPAEGTHIQSDGEALTIATDIGTPEIVNQPDVQAVITAG